MRRMLSRSTNRHSNKSMDQKLKREHYRVFYPITTRWDDNDIYGHINNVRFYSFFDSAVNRFLIEEGGLDIHNANVVGYVVESKCQYHSPLAYPEAIEVGITIGTLGNRSVTYEVAVFKQGEQIAAANGHFVHVFVDKQSSLSVPIPLSISDALKV